MQKFIRAALIVLTFLVPTLTLASVQRFECKFSTEIGHRQFNYDVAGKLQLGRRAFRLVGNPTITISEWIRGHRVFHHRRTPLALKKKERRTALFALRQAQKGLFVKIFPFEKLGNLEHRLGHRVGKDFGTDCRLY